MKDQDCVKDGVDCGKYECKYLNSSAMASQVHKCNLHTTKSIPPFEAHFPCPARPRPNASFCSLTPAAVTIPAAAVGCRWHQCRMSLTLLDYIVAWRVRYLISSSAVQMICPIERYLPASFLSSLRGKSEETSSGKSHIPLDFE